MNKNIFGNLMLFLIFLVIVFFGYAIVNSIDIKRLREEKLIKDNRILLRTLKNIEKTLKNPGRQFIQAAVSNEKSSVNPDESNNSLSEKPKNIQVANLEFFNSAADFGGRKISAITSQTKNMNYLINNESLAGAIWGYCFDSLAERNYAKPEEFQSMLAESWSLSDDKMTYTIHLRKGVLWHDFTDPVTGKEWTNVPVTAADFKFYVDVIKNPKTDCAPLRGYMKDLDGIEVISDYEFKVHWKKKYFLSESMTLGLQPLPRHLYHAYSGPFDPEKFNDDHQRNRIVVGCGPYRFAGWDKNQKIILKKWEKYYGSDLGIEPPIEYLELKIMANKNTQFQALLGKRIDEMSLSPDQWVNNTSVKEFDSQKGFLKKLKYPARVYRYIGYNLKKPIFKDKRVRQALTHLVDRKRIIKEVYHGLARIITGNFFIDTVYNDKTIKPYSFSVSKALELLNQAGWKDTNGDGILDKDGENFEFTIISPNNSQTYDKMLPMIKEDMAKAGVIMNINKIEWSVFIQLLGKKEFEACICGWGLGLESDPYQLWHSSQADMPESSNHVGFKNKEADKLIAEIRVCFDLKKRIELCHKFHKIMHEEQPYTFLFSPYSLTAIDKRYENVRIFPIGIPDKIQWVPKSMQKRITE